jgi:endo-1,4-beta-D-glucanase Y
MCSGVCADLQTSPQNCGACGTICSAGQSCTAGVCGCAAGQQACGGACTDVMTNPLNCGMCGTMCAGGQTCSAGVCTAVMTPSCAAGQEDCNGTCVPAGSCVSSGGAGAGGGPAVGPDGCPVEPGLIIGFEDQTYEVPANEGRAGIVDTFNDGTGTQETTIEEDGTDPCNKYVLHTTGSGFTSWGAGVGSVFAGTFDQAAADGEGEFVPPENGYDASQYTAISFRAKAGGNQQNPVRFNISVPGSEGPPYGNGSCADMADVDNPCWNHLGQFLADDEELTTQWQTFTFCFDRDLYPMFLPSHLTVEERNTVSSQLLKFQFQFNQSFDTEGVQVPLSDQFDFYLDDIKFTNPASCDGEIFQSTDGATDPFGTNSEVGNCMPVPNAAKFNKAISEAYARWKTRYVGSDGGVIDPDEGNRVVSEAIGYGMLITAAMGDKPTFDKIYGWAKGKGAPGSLIGWENGSGGSASDADTDIAFALLMAGKQWGGTYAADGGTAAGAALSGDVQGNLIRGGNGFLGVFNPSYFSPGFYRKFSGWGSVIDTTYGVVGQCASSFGGLVPDWCSPEGQAVGAGQTGAQVVAAEVCTDSNAPCLAFESARTPWRLGHDVCFDSQGESVLSGMISKLLQTDSSLEQGARIDTIEAGWNASGPLEEGVGNAMAFIGPLGVAGMALDNAAVRDRAFRATLDIMERPEFYNTYYQTTLGLIALLTMSGNFPTP